jgi:hypothetical protein
MNREENSVSKSQVRRVMLVQKLLGRVPGWMMQSVEGVRVGEFEAPRVEPRQRVKVAKTKFRTYYFLVG